MKLTSVSTVDALLTSQSVFSLSMRYLEMALVAAAAYAVLVDATTGWERLAGLIATHAWFEKVRW
jgi:hypothetical protein